MASKPPKIDQRTYEDIVRQIEALAEDDINDGNRGWKPPGAMEVEPKRKLLSGRILNQDLTITFKEPTVAELTGRILNKDFDLGKEKLKKGTLLNNDQAQSIVQKIEEETFIQKIKEETSVQKIEEETSKKLTPPESEVDSEGSFWSRLKNTIEDVIDYVEDGFDTIEDFFGSSSESPEVEVLVARNTLIDAALARQISQIERSKPVKVKAGQPGAKVDNDAGEALIRIFARMVELVSDRLNQVPEKNFLTFLELIGGQLKPPQPAKVPLTFYLAEGSLKDALVPAHTQVSAPPTKGSEEEIVFETDRELVVTIAQLKAVLVREPSQDKYNDCTLPATGKEDEAFFAFKGDRPIEHSLYITFPEIFALAEIDNLDLIITGDNEGFQSLQEKLDWSYWDGSQWGQLTNLPTYEDDKFTFSKLPIPTASEVHGRTEKWLRAKLTDISAISDNSPQITNIKGSVNVTQSNLIPEVCLFNNTPLDLSKDFYPFGEQPQINDTFYIALHDAYIKPNASITLIFKLTHQSNVTSAEITIDWEIKEKEEWKKIGTDFNNDAISIKIVDSSLPNFVKESPLSAEFKISETNIPSPSTINGKTRYWIRARITQGRYGKAADERKYPVYNDLAILTSEVKEDDKAIAVDSLDLFQVSNTIRLFPNTGGFPEEHQITAITEETKQLTLDSGIVNDELAVGTRVMRKSIITETIPATYDPPLVKSIKLTYNFLLEENAIYCADNDFNCIFTPQLKEEAHVGDESLSLIDVKDFEDKDIITINNAEEYEIKSINSETNKVTLTSAISQEYAKNTIIHRNFRPFTPTVDKDPTLYLGFDKSFDNKTVTLYAQVEPPSPDELLAELSTDITLETSLEEEVSAKEKTLKLADIHGWGKGDRIQIKSNEKQGDLYTITHIHTNIDSAQKEVTIFPPLRHDYEPETKIIRPTTKPKLVWEYSSPSGWQTLGVQDETKAFSQRGLIQFIAPEDFRKRETFGKQLYWLRVRWQEGNFRVAPRLRRILTNTMWAVQATTFKKEILGSSNADPNQVFVAKNSPILRGQRLEVQEGKIIPPDLESDRFTVIKDELGEIESVWVKWQEVSDFYSSAESDRHYVLNRQTAEIQFGDGIAGMIPPRGQNNIRLSFYRTGGGKQGNVGSQTVSQLKTTIPYINKVKNFEAAAGGASQEDLEHYKERVPKKLRHQHRAVTIDDITDLAYEASTDVARAKTISSDMMMEFDPLDSSFWDLEDHTTANKLRELGESAGQVKLIILPDSSAPQSGSLRDRQPVPSLALLEKVETYIRSRCQPTMDLIVTAPIWQEVAIETTIVPLSLENGDRLKDEVRQALEKFLHPLTGGKKQQGWEFGRHPHASDFYSIIQSIKGVDWVKDLIILVDSQEVFSSDKLESENQEIDNSSIDSDTLIYSGNHKVTVTS